MAGSLRNTRILRELAEAVKDATAECTTGLVDDSDLYLWHATITGPVNSPYEGGTFKLKIQLRKDYPFSPPIVTFVTRIFHPNISKDGEICISILQKENWLPALTIPKVARSVASLLSDPNPDNPLEATAAAVLRRSKFNFETEAKFYTWKYAQGEKVKDDLDINVRGIFQGIYSRQVYVLGENSMLEMTYYCGVRSVNIYDPENTTSSDLSSQFFLRDEDIGKNRAQACLAHLRKLNPFVRVNVLDDLATEDNIKNFKTVVVTGGISNEQLLILSTICHDYNVPFVLAQTRGVFSRIFCDFGLGFVVQDLTGEPPMTASIVKVTQGHDGHVTCDSDSAHGLENGDYVTFKDIEGMEELNTCDPVEVQVTGPFTFSIGDTSGFKEYIQGGVVIQHKSRKINFKSFQESLIHPDFQGLDIVTAQAHVGFLALDHFMDKYGSLPRPWNHEDARTLLQMAKELNEIQEAPLKNLDQRFLRLVSCVSAGNLSPINAVIGGIAAQEVSKACTGKFCPIKQWLYFDASECVPEVSEHELCSINEDNFTPMNGRYDGQIAILGKEFQKKLGNLRYLIEGIGSTGCEILKNFTMMGVGSGAGEVIVVDMEIIDRPLGRQFLFGSSDTGKAKCTAACEAVKVMNPEVKIIGHQNAIGPSSESIYTDEFFERLDGVAAGLDNVEGRLYINGRCVQNRKPLLECGTLGAKGNVQVILPYLTESYSCSQDPVQEAIPACTLKNFPTETEHTLYWGSGIFQELFHDSVKCVTEYLNNPNYLAEIFEKPIEIAVHDLMTVKEYLVDQRPKEINDCISWARQLWEKLFNNHIQQLIANFPRDHETCAGQYFWAYPKRFPTALEFNNGSTDPNSPHYVFVYAAANLRAQLYGIPQLRDPFTITEMALEIVTPPFRTYSEIQASDTDLTSLATGRREAIIAQIPRPEQLRDLRMKPLDFHPDNDLNLHNDFVFAASCCRAMNYELQPPDHLQTMLIAGKIVPGMATTSSVIAGLLGLELIKITQGFKDLSRYKNSYVNLALPLVTSSEPVKPIQKIYNDVSWTRWNRFTIGGEMTLQEFINFFVSKFKLSIRMVTYDTWVIYGPDFDPTDLQDRMSLPLCQVVAIVSKKKIPSYVRSLIFEISCQDEAGEEVEVPYVRYVIPESQLHSAASLH